MGQVTIYLENELEKKVRTSAKAENISLSKWIARLIEEKTASEWPESVKRLAGAWKDFPEIDEIRSGMPEDSKREAF